MPERKPLFKNYNYLYESNAKQLTEIEQRESNSISQIIKKDIDSCAVKIVAYLGPNGSGKSTVLNDAIKNLEKDIIFAPYEIWQYQDESRAWENFLITILSKDAKTKNKNKVAKKLQQGKIRIFPFMLLLSSGLLSAGLSFLFIPIGSQFVNVGRILFSLLGITAISYLSSRIIISNGASYIYQYEDELLKILSKSKRKPIVVLVEDIDRSIHGEKIIESLHVFINNHRKDIKRPFIVICPMARESFYGIPASTGDYNGKKKRLERIELSNKIYDYVIDGKLSNKITSSELSNLFKSVGCSSKRLENFFSKLLPTIKADSSLINIRAIKFILREIDQFIQKYPTLDERIAAFHIVSKYIENNINGSYGSEHAITMTLTHSSGTGTNSLNTHTAYIGLVGYTFDIEKLIEEHSNPNANFTIPVHFNYVDSLKKHKAIYKERNPQSNTGYSIDVSLSSKYKELL